MGAQAIAGVPVHMAFDPSTRVFELVYNATISTAPTEVYLNEPLHYPDGVDVDVKLLTRSANSTIGGAGCSTIVRLRNRVHVTIAARCVGQVVVIQLAPKSPID